MINNKPLFSLVLAMFTRTLILRADTARFGQLLSLSQTSSTRKKIKIKIINDQEFTLSK